MSVQIYYFSGTGNSLHAAEQLRRKLPGAGIEPIVGALRHRRLSSAADTVGFVFPVHAHTIPLPVEAFLRRADLGSASYLFALATSETFTQARADIDRLLARQGRRLDSFFDVHMPWNYLPIFDVDTPEEIEAKDIALDAKLEDIRAVVSSRERRLPKTSAPVLLVSLVMSPVIKHLFRKTRYFGVERKFFPDERCTGCGTCASVCLSGKIRMVRGKPEWRKDVRCVFCFACIHFCPAGALQIRGSKSAARGRYRHPGVSPADIAAQKK